jgi:putative addiction module component (TIGR02574 family)
MNLEQLKDAVADLAPNERAELAQFLLDSLNGDEEKAARGEWLALAQSRMAEVKAGKVVGIPAEEVIRTLLEPGR